jgi:hypothetical protein
MPSLLQRRPVRPSRPSRLRRRIRWPRSIRRDRAVAEKIRDLLAAKADKIFASKKERTAVDAFYQNRNFAPLWLDKGHRECTSQGGDRPHESGRCRRPRDQRLQGSDLRRPERPDALAEAELKLTQTVLTYARHLQAGRFPYTRVSNTISSCRRCRPTWRRC